MKDALGVSVRVLSTNTYVQIVDFFCSYFSCMHRIRHPKFLVFSFISACFTSLLLFYSTKFSCFYLVLFFNYVPSHFFRRLVGCFSQSPMVFCCVSIVTAIFFNFLLQIPILECYLQSLSSILSVFDNWYSANQFRLPISVHYFLLSFLFPLFSSFYSISPWVALPFLLPTISYFSFSPFCEKSTVDFQDTDIVCEHWLMLVLRGMEAVTLEQISVDDSDATAGSPQRHLLQASVGQCLE